MTIAEFLAARLDEDEAAAKAVRPDQDYADSAHQERWSPARVLREVEARRTITAEHAATGGWTAYGDHMCRRCVYSDDEPHDELHHWVAFPCPTLRALAAVWSDHPDYRQEWASEHRK